jgi:hypothetical protein
VTVAFLLSKQIEWVQCVFYVLAQTGGSILASWLLLFWFEYDILGGYNTIPRSSATGEKLFLAAFIVELITTMLLLYAVFATIDPRRNSATDLGPLAIGGAVMICHLIAVPVTGCGINPARSIGPAIWGAQVGRDDLWLFIVAPLCASAIVAFTYPYFFAEQAFAVGGLRARFQAKTCPPVVLEPHDNRWWLKNQGSRNYTLAPLPSSNRIHTTPLPSQNASSTSELPRQNSMASTSRLASTARLVSTTSRLTSKQISPPASKR